ncbi:MAG: hypothetical protein LBH74_08425 [Nitrososphaerota archaeon]|jgi:polyhydroxyalkanoate synthesis regulator phasin|nr:hypothetical protein [Nitrososphaerota archaeon]
MGYDLKQISAKVAKISVAFLVAGGAAVFGGATIPAAVLSLLTAGAVSQGLGELAEGAISGLTPKDKGVIQRLTKTIQSCVSEQLKDVGCPRRYRKTAEKCIMSTLFSSPVSILVSSVDKPENALNLVEQILNKVMTSKSDSEAFVDALFNQIIANIDNNHEFTSLYYLKKIDSGMETIRPVVDATRQKVDRLEEDIGQIKGQIVFDSAIRYNSEPISYSSFHFAAGNVDFVGRKDELNHLKAFCGYDSEMTAFLTEQPTFAWWVVIGEGASGKSRLCYEFGKLLSNKDWSVCWPQTNMAMKT